MAHYCFFVDIDLLASTSSVSVNVDVCARIDLAAEHVVTVFPNPSHGIMQVQAPHPIDLLEVFDASGRLLVR